MKRLLWIILLSVIAVSAALFLHENNGSVRFLFGQQQIDLSLNLFVFLLLAGFALFYLLLRAVIHTMRLPATVRAYRDRQAQKKSLSAMYDAMTSFFEGRYGHAEKAAASALKHPASHVLLSVIAARSAHQLGDFDKRDEYLSQAEHRSPEAGLMRQITQAELFLKERRLDDALEVLKRVRSEAPKNITAIKLELKAQTLAKNWDEALALTALLEKRNAILPQHAAQNRFNAQLGNLQRKTQDPALLLAYWQQLPAADKHNVTLALSAARSLMATGRHDEAKNIIEQTLSKEWDAGLVHLYGECRSSDLLKQVEWADAQLKQNPKDPDLLLALGKLCTDLQLWGKAQSYLEASLAIESKRETHLAITRLLEKSGKPEEAARHNRRSFSSSSD
ncbi:MAG: heme biosynthesis protein HemY [Burkholderiales bacterium]